MMIRSEETLYAGKSFFRKDDLTKFIENQYIDKLYRNQISQELVDYIKSNFTQKADKVKYLIVDPLNHTYNPAKNIHKFDRTYPTIFRELLNDYIDLYI